MELQGRMQKMLWILSFKTSAIKPFIFFYFSTLLGPRTWWFWAPEQCDTLLFPIQSPIKIGGSNLEKQKIIEAHNLPDLKLSNEYSILPSRINLSNNGGGLTLIPFFDRVDENSILVSDLLGGRSRLSGGPLTPGKSFSLDHITWHWGFNPLGADKAVGHGAEHQIGDKRFCFV